jgi:ParB/RepB/Spo0J family partition protein
MVEFWSETVFIDAIIVPPRIRQKLTRIEDIKQSIKDDGLINPITLYLRPDGVYELMAGEGRLEALKRLGHDRVPCRVTNNPNYLARRRIELNENVKRQADLTWQELAETYAELHEIYETENPDGWTREDTAKKLDIHRTTLGQYLDQVEARRNGYTEAWGEKEFTTARDMLIRREKRQAQRPLQQVLDEINFSPIEDPPTRVVEKGKGQIIDADFCELVKTYDGPKFNFLHIDFPYGINTEKRQQGDAIKVLGGYDDSPETYRHLLGTLCENLDKICMPHAHIMFWVSMKNYTETFATLSKHFKMDPFPLFWLKSNNKGMIPDSDRGPRRIYETCLFGTRGDRPIVRAVSNAICAPTDTSIHPSAKPKEVLDHFFQMFVDEFTSMLDPTCGSATAIRAAEARGAERILGIEINEDFVVEAEQALQRMRFEAGDLMQ